MGLNTLNLELINEQVDPTNGLGGWLGSFAHGFLVTNKAVYDKLFRSEYFGLDRETKCVYSVMNAVNHYLLSMYFVREDIHLAIANNKEYDVEELENKYNIDCIIRYIECNSDINGWELQEVVEEAYENYDLGISEMAIGETFIIR